MSAADILRTSVVSVVANDAYSHAVVLLSDDSRLYFCHRVDERWARAAGPGESEDETGMAGQLLARIARFRLNAKHLDIAFPDGSRWERCFAG